MNPQSEKLQKESIHIKLAAVSVDGKVTIDLGHQV